MRLGDALKLISRLEHRLAVLDDLVAYLEREDLQIPVDRDEGVVPRDIVQEVLQDLKELREADLCVFDELEELEVENAK